MEREKRRMFLFADSHVFLQENIISVVGFSSVLRRKYTKFSKGHHRRYFSVSGQCLFFFFLRKVSIT